MYRFSRAIFVEIKDLVDPHPDTVSVPGGPAPGAAVLRGDDRAAGPRPAVLREAQPEPLLGDPASVLDLGPGARLPVDRPAHLRRGRAHPRRARARGRGPGAPVQGDDPQGQAVPAHAAARSRVLPVAPAPRGAPARLRRSRLVGHRQRELPVPVEPRHPDAHQADGPGRWRSARSSRLHARSPIAAASSMPTDEALRPRRDREVRVAHLRRHGPRAHAARSSDAARPSDIRRRDA